MCTENSDWKISKVNSKGIKHQRTNQPCQDKTYGFYKGDLSVIALADGAGSYRYSHIGARLSTRIVCGILADKFDSFYDQPIKVTKHNIINCLLHNINQTAKSLNINNVKEFSSTLIFSAIKDNRMIYGHIGDGISCLLTQDGLQVLTQPENGEFPNLTYFTTSEDIENHLRLYKQNIISQGFRGIGLMSDGTASSLYNNRDGCFSKVIMDMFGWLENYSEKDINIVLSRVFKKKIVSRTEDDCSFIMMKKMNKKGAFK